jgi:hypothetical protein
MSQKTCFGNCQARNTDLCSATTCSNYPPLPYCAEPDDRWPPQINACLREILRYRKQQLDPEGYRKELIEQMREALAAAKNDGKMQSAITYQLIRAALSAAERGK